MHTQDAISLRALEPSDIDCLYIWENNPEMWDHGVSAAPYSRHQLWEYIHSYNADPLRDGQLRLMITAPIKGNAPGETSATAIGCIDLYDIKPQHGRAFVGIMIAPAFRRRGFALQALNLIADYASRTLHLRQLAATIADDNAPSLALFARAGYTRTATLPSWLQRTSGTYVDASILQLFL